MGYAAYFRGTMCRGDFTFSSLILMLPIGFGPLAPMIEVAACGASKRRRSMGHA